MVTATRVQILNEAVCISHNANTLGEGMKHTIHSQAMCDLVGQTQLCNLGMAIDLDG